MSTLNPYFYAYNPELLAFENAWVQFIKEGALNSSAISKDVEDSWRRCRQSKLDPLSRTPPPLLPQKELDCRLKANEKILAVVMPFLKTLFHIVKGTGFRVDFVDREGYIICSMMDEVVEPLCQKTLSCPGAGRSEETAGTSSIALARLLKKPVQISGAEHYQQMYHRWSCSSAPILDHSGQVLGVVNAASRYEQIHKHTLGMVTAAAKAIENELHIKRINEELEKNNRQLSATLSMVSDGLVYMKGGRIYQVNEEMSNLLGKPQKQLVGQKVEDVIITTPDIMKMLNDEIRDYNIRGVILEGKERNYNCLFDIKTIYNSPAKTVHGEEEKSEKVMIFMRVEEVQSLAEKIKNAARFQFSHILGNSPALQNALMMAKRAALYNSRVIIEGESGTGKEMLAQAIHNHSNRRYNPFVAIDCGAIPKELFESELFGYEGGAFTGARKEGKTGLLELANKGTVFLDEVGNMPMEMQVKLLRVLQEGVVTKVGGTENIPVDVRVIAASNADLKGAVENGEFREDLFYRLNVFHIVMPSLKERKEDIPLLINHFIKRESGRRKNVSVTPEAMELLMGYDWPGNIRQLYNVIERALIMSDGIGIKGEDLPLELSLELAPKQAPPLARKERVDISLAHRMNAYIRSVVEANNGNITKAAEVLKVSRTTVYKALSYGADETGHSEEKG